MYNPLPNQIEIGKSSIHGLGLFATEYIPKNTILGITHVAHDLFPDGWIRTPLGGFYNHSENPNCKLVDQWKKQMAKLTFIKRFNKVNNMVPFTAIKLLQTTEDIKKDTELTCTYTIWQATPEMRETIGKLD